MKKPLASMLLCLISIAGVFSQSLNTVRVGGVAETISLPFQFNDPLKGGLELSTDLWYREKEKSIRQINLSFMAFFREGVNNNYYLLGSYEHQFFLGHSLALSLEGGLGYVHTFFAGTAYRLENGTYASTRFASKPGVAARLGAGFYLRRQKAVQPYISYGWMLDYTFPPIFPPVTPHSILQIGLRVSIHP
ncbi:MAG: hypothetical protein AAF824_23820 [Bacteroidota bacterium]